MDMFEGEHLFTGNGDTENEIERERERLTLRKILKDLLTHLSCRDNM